MLRFNLARLMMDQGAELAFFLARAAGEDQERHPFGKGSGNRIDHVMATGAISYADHANVAGCASIAVGGEAYAGLVRQRQDFKIVFASQGKEELQRQISRNAE